MTQHKVTLVKDGKTRVATTPTEEVQLRSVGWKSAPKAKPTAAPKSDSK